MVDAGRFVEGQKWATNRSDGRHFRPLVPLELWALLDALTSPPPPPLFRHEQDGVKGDGGVDSSAVTPEVTSVEIEKRGDER